MIRILLALVFVLWLAGFVHIAFLDAVLFSVANRPFSLHSLLLLLLLIFIIRFLPGIFQMIAIGLLILWLLSIFGVFVFGGLSQILIIILIIAVLFSIF